MCLHEGTIKVPRKRADIRAALDHIAGLGACDVTVTQKRKIHLRWSMGGIEMAVSVGCSPRSVDESTQMTLQHINRRLRQAVLH
ncbi:hypothetical protein [Beijerinckia sp. L45]|uniref:hypothetical protein n=1 Tax=Beijerinckia sp. L45 TaxID=1641855 RepID=UPI00131A80E7|nr:hypothetical protein [Beijerinckia sp. L45]